MFNDPFTCLLGPKRPVGTKASSDFSFKSLSFHLRTPSRFPKPITHFSTKLGFWANAEAW